MRIRPCRVRSAAALLTTTAVVFLLHAFPLFADIFSYECDVLPADGGWTLLQAWCGPEEWVEDGQLFQHVELCEGFPSGQQFDYQRLMGVFLASGSFFVEWTMETEGDSSEIPFVAPAALVVFDGNALIYHFTIADDLIRLIRQLPQNPILFFEIQPGLTHIYRLELFGDNLDEVYVVYIDGEVVDSGLPEGPLFNPPYDAQVLFRTKAKFAPSTAIWDYIRWGNIPSEGSGDFNGDDLVNFDDLPFFIECLSGSQGSWSGCAWADMDFDGDTDCDDWHLFVEAWTDPADPPGIPECECAPPDLNCDGNVGPFDLAALLVTWGSCADCDDCPPDLNGDCTVGPADLAMLLGNWG